MSGVQLEGANITSTNLSGATLESLELDGTTVFRPSSMFGAGLRDTDYSSIDTGVPFHQAFGDGSVRLPEGLEAGKPPLAHWPTESLELEEWLGRWRAWQREIEYTLPE